MMGETQHHHSRGFTQSDSLDGLFMIGSVSFFKTGLQSTDIQTKHGRRLMRRFMSSRQPWASTTCREFSSYFYRNIGFTLDAEDEASAEYCERPGH